MKKTKMIKKNYEFKEILSKGNYYSGLYVEVFIKKEKKENINFLGVAISRKIGKAVKRNYIKRLIKESYYFYENSIKVGYKIVFLWKKKKSIENATFENIKKDIRKILEDSKMLEENI